MCQPATKRIVLAYLNYFMSKLNSWMKEIVPKRSEICSSSGTKSAAAGCKQAVNDDERCQSFALVVFQHLHKSFVNLLQTTWLHKSTNINAHMWLRQRNLSSNLELTLTYFHRSLYVSKGPEEMSLLLEHQNPSKTSEKNGLFLSRYSFVTHSIYTANQETEGSQDRLTV